MSRMIKSSHLVPDGAPRVIRSYRKESATWAHTVPPASMSITEKACSTLLPGVAMMALT